MAKHVSHLKSHVVTEGSPKLPQPSQLMYGEIAINYADGYERLAIKNDNDEIITFVPNTELENLKSDVEENEKVTANALNDLNTRVAEISSLSTDLNSLEETVDTLSETTDELSDSIDEIKEYVEEGSKVTANALNDLDNRIKNLSDDSQSQTSNLENEMSELREYVEDVEYVLSQTMNDLNTRIGELSEMLEYLQDIVDSL